MYLFDFGHLLCTAHRALPENRLQGTKTSHFVKIAARLTRCHTTGFMNGRGTLAVPKGPYGR